MRPVTCTVCRQPSQMDSRSVYSAFPKDSCRVDRGTLAVSQGLDVAHGRLAEKAAVFAIELRGAFVADFECGTGGIETILEHQAPRGLKAELFLILKRTHCGQHAEMMMQRRYAHAGDLREFLHVQWLSVVRAYPRYRFCRSVTLIAKRGNCP